MTVSRHDRPERDRRTSPNRRGGLDRRVGDRRLDSAPPGGERRQGAERRAQLDRRHTAGRRRTERARTHPLVVLYVGEDARPVQELLDASSGERFELEATDRRSAALERLNRGDIDVVLLDLSLSHGLETFAEPSTTGPAPPFLVLSRSDDERLALEAVRAGAQDFLA